MEKFNSLFELFAAFNFAYVFSADLIKNFNEKLGGNFHKAETSLSSIDLTIQNIDTYIVESKKDGAHNSEVLNNLLTEFGNEKGNYTIDRNRTLNHIKSSLEKSKFSYLCLFSGLYSILILMFAGYDIIDLKNNNHVEYLFWFNLLALFSIFILLSEYFYFWRTDHISTTITFIVTLIITFVIISISSFWSFHWCPFISKGVVFLSILIASWHFFMYFVKIYINQKKKGTELITITNNWHTKFNDLNTRLSVAINVSSENNKTIKKQTQGRRITPK